MKAILVRKHGGPSVLTYETVKNFSPKNGHVIVKVDYCALNHLDIWVRKGLPGRTVSFPHILGSDVCGTMTESYREFKKNDKVVIYPAIESGTPRTKFSIIGAFSEYQGGYAEFIQVPRQNIVRKPDWLSDKEACVLNVSYLTAWNMIEKSGCEENDTILIWGANSGVGSAAILLAKAKGIQVITVASNLKKIDFAKKLGADHIIDRTESEISNKILRYTENEGVDAVIDHVGATTWPVSLEVLKIGGKMLACGTTTGPQAKVDIRMFYSKEAQIIGAYLGTKSQLVSLHKFMKLKKIKPLIDQVFELKDAKLAHERMEHSNQFGKIVLKI